MNAYILTRKHAYCLSRYSLVSQAYPQVLKRHPRIYARLAFVRERCGRVLGVRWGGGEMCCAGVGEVSGAVWCVRWGIKVECSVLGWCAGGWCGVYEGVKVECGVLGWDGGGCTMGANVC